MPRPEAPPQGDHPGVVEFAGDLRRLREAAGGPTYRQIAARAHYSAAALSEAANGRKLPSLPVTRAYVAACEGDVAAWESRWRRLAAELADPTEPDGGADRALDAPYVGLRSFQVDDADRFFGRGQVLADLVARARRSRLVVVFGASGSGKSSLLRAGLLKRALTTGLDGAGPAPALVMTPGGHPVEECAVQVAAWSGRSAAALRVEFAEHPENLHLRIRQALVERSERSDLVLVVDQCEELFTACHDPGERDAFLALLTAAVDADTSRTRVVLGVRADFLPQCTDYPTLLRAINEAAVIVGPMSTDELRLAITEPARRQGLTVETALVARLVADAVSQPAALPLVSHALLATWGRRRGTTLTVDGYEAVGGIQHAVARTAEDQYMALSTDQQALAKQLFLRLVAISDATTGPAIPQTRRRISHGEMTSLGLAMEQVVAVLVRARLITSADTGVEIAHEALIHAWPRLRAWLDQDRDGMLIHRLLTDATQYWELSGRDPDFLYRGSRLAAAQHCTKTTDTVLTDTEREFLAASVAAHAQQQARSRRRTRRLQQLVGLLGVLLVVAASTTVVAVRAQRTVVQQRDQAVIQNGFSRATALGNTDPALAMQLALAAYWLDPSQPIRNNVLNSLDSPYVQPLTALGDSINDAAASGDGTLLATGSNGDLLGNGSSDGSAVRVWDVADPRHPRVVATLPGQDSTDPQAAIDPLALSVHGHLLFASPSPDSSINGIPLTDGQLWDLTRPQHPVLLATLPAAAFFGAFSDDGHLLVTGNVLWDITNPRSPVVDAHLSTDATGPIAFSQDGRTLVDVARHGQDRDVDLFDISSPHRPVRTGVITVATGDVSAVAINSAGTTLAVGTASGATQLWTIPDTHQPTLAATLTPQTGAVSTLAFSPDWDALATSTNDGSINVWNVAATAPHELASLIGHTTSDQLAAAAVGMTFESDGDSLLVAGVDNRAEWVRLPDFALTSRTDNAQSMTFSPDGRTAAISDTAGVHLWDLHDPTHVRPDGVLPAPSPPAAAAAMAASDVGRYVLLSGRDQVLITGGPFITGLWNVADPNRPRLLATMTDTSGPFALSSDGRLLITGSWDAATKFDNGVALWDITDPYHPRLRSTIDNRTATKFSFDGNLLAIADYHGVDLQNASDPNHPQMVDPFLQPNGTPAAPSPPLSFLPHTHTLAVTAQDGTVQLWNLTDPLRPTITGVLASGPNAASVTATITASPDGHLLATNGANHTVLVWEVTDHTHPVLLDVLTDATNPVVFNPDGHTLAVIDTNGAVRLRETDMHHAAAQVCALTGATLDRTTWNRYFPGLTYQPPC